MINFSSEMGGVVLRIAICDDEEILCSQLEEMLLKIARENGEQLDIDVFFSGEELYKYLNQEVQYDIIFLDIELDMMSGVEVGYKIRNELQNDMTQIVYISGNESYAMELFQIRPLNFLIKPVSYERIVTVFNTALRIVNKGNQYYEYQFKHASYKVPIKDILYFESENRKINIITKDDTRTFYGTLDDVFEKVKQYNFLDIHKSYLVNYNYIVKFEYRQVTLTNDRVLPISQMNRKRIRALQLEIEKDGVSNATE